MSTIWDDARERWKRLGRDDDIVEPREADARREAVRVATHATAGTAGRGAAARLVLRRTGLGLLVPHPHHPRQPVRRELGQVSLSVSLSPLLADTETYENRPRKV